MNDPTNKEEERFVDFLKNAAHEAYNPPPETPRDEMWAVIQAERATQRDDGKIVSIHPHRSRLWWIGVAAALVIGVGLGRVSLWNPAESGEQVATVQEPPAGEAPEGITNPVRDDDADAADAAEVAPAPEIDGPTMLASDVGHAGASPDDATAAQAPSDGGTTAAPTLRKRSTLPYRVAAADLLTRSETFLTMFRTDGGDEALNAQFATWARTLLMQTRLMIDSPAGEDLQMKALLEDLELALVQIVQLGGATDEEETRRIGDGLDDGQLLFKLRSLPDPKRVGT
jgi:hypothetical protein